ncbi:hypothetical protein BV898_01034 [Hypsibius exemplaris]|uniref:C2H2-type domain-containing protein n=1 Tax=Hypsibius exemplaris TaxID=2072580 RepID=A0A1W0XCZ0_HYPEX|nr:hypothetical protein BV898_01034 [Hypsibius exemplaris]
MNYFDYEDFLTRNNFGIENDEFLVKTEMDAEVVDGDYGPPKLCISNSPDIISSTATKGDRISVERTEGPSNFVCNVCAPHSSFANAEQLKQHQSNQHTSNRVESNEHLQCFFPDCRYTTLFWCELACHESSHRNDAGSYVCTQRDCSYVCSSFAVMKDHLQRLHSRARLHCDCGSVFQDITSFRIHVRYCPTVNSKKIVATNGTSHSTGLGMQKSSGWTVPANKISSSYPNQSIAHRNFEGANFASRRPKSKRRSGSDSSNTSAPVTLVNKSTTFGNDAPGRDRTASRSNFPPGQFNQDGSNSSLPFTRLRQTSEIAGATGKRGHDSRELLQGLGLPVGSASSYANNLNDGLIDGLLPCKTEPDGSHDWDATDRFSDIGDDETAVDEYEGFVHTNSDNVENEVMDLRLSAGSLPQLLNLFG